MIEGYQEREALDLFTCQRCGAFSGPEILCDRCEQAVEQIQAAPNMVGVTCPVCGTENIYTARTWNSMLTEEDMQDGWGGVVGPAPAGSLVCADGHRLAVVALAEHEEENR